MKYQKVNVKKKNLFINFIQKNTQNTCYWVQVCSACCTTGQWIWETRGWGKEKTLTREPAQEDVRLVLQNNHLSGVWMPDSFIEQREKSNEEWKSNGKIEKGSEVKASSVLDISKGMACLSKGCVNLFSEKAGLNLNIQKTKTMASGPISSDQFSSVAQSYRTLFKPMNWSTPGFPVHHQLPEFTQTHVHWVGDAIQPSHPLSSPSPPALSLSQHQALFKWVSPSHQVAKVLEFQLQHQSFQWTPRTDLL